MKNYALCAFIYSALTLALAGCGGHDNGGNNITIPPAATKAITKLYLFGNMSSNSKVTSVQAAVTVPSGIMVNYSSPAPAGYPANTYPLKSGFAVPSGPVRVAEADISGKYNTDSRELTIYLVNQSGVALRSSMTGNGAEIARLNFTLAVAGAIPALPAPWQDPLVKVGQELATQPLPTVISLTGCILNFVTTYQ